MKRSKAFADYLQNRREVKELLKAAPSVSEQLKSRRLLTRANAMYRGSVVLISSHLEGYVESVAVEAVDAINMAQPVISSIPELLRVTQVDQSLRTAHETKDVSKKILAVKALVNDFGWFGDDGLTFGRIKSEPLIRSFSNPLPEEIRRIFKHFGIQDVIAYSIKLEKSPGRGIIEAKVRELVEKRNQIAHSSTATSVTENDIRDYLRCTFKFIWWCDIVVGQEIQKLTGSWPWQ